MAKQITKLTDLPEGECFAALVETSFTYDDGYGDPGQPSTSIHHSLDFVVIGNAEAVSNWVIEHESRKNYTVKPYRIIKVRQAAIVKTVSVEVA
jgi:hypothetical protein